MDNKIDGEVPARSWRHSPSTVVWYNLVLRASVNIQQPATLICGHAGRLIVPRRPTRTNDGDRSFAVQGPRVWNSLPDELYVHRLKTYVTI